MHRRGAAASEDGNTLLNPWPPLSGQDDYSGSKPLRQGEANKVTFHGKIRALRVQWNSSNANCNIDKSGLAFSSFDVSSFGVLDCAS